MTDPTRPIADPTDPTFLEGDDVLRPPPADDVEGHVRVGRCPDGAHRSSWQTANLHLPPFTRTSGPRPKARSASEGR